MCASPHFFEPLLELYTAILCPACNYCSLSRTYVLKEKSLPCPWHTLFPSSPVSALPFVTKFSSSTTPLYITFYIFYNAKLSMVCCLWSLTCGWIGVLCIKTLKPKWNALRHKHLPLSPFHPQQPLFYFLLAATIIFPYGPQTCSEPPKWFCQWSFITSCLPWSSSFCLLVLFLVLDQLKFFFIFFSSLLSHLILLSQLSMVSCLSPIHPLPWPASTVFSILPSPQPVAILPPLYLSPTLTFCLIFSFFSLFSILLSSTINLLFSFPRVRFSEKAQLTK